jgi:hypothetical protein
MNDKTRMTNDETMTNDEAQKTLLQSFVICSFEILSGFVICHSSFSEPDGPSRAAWQAERPSYNIFWLVLP